MPRVITMSAANSLVTSLSPSIANDGVESAPIVVTVVDTNGNPVQGLAANQCVIAVNGTGNTVTQPSAPSDTLGRFFASFVSTVAETKTVSATVRGLAITDTASVVSGVADPFTPNKPTGVTLVRSNDGSSLSFAGSFGSQASYSDASAPYSPNSVLRFVYPAGERGSGFNTGNDSGNLPSGTVRVYLSYAIWLSSNYSIHPGGIKNFYFYHDTGGTLGSLLVDMLPTDSDYEAGGLELVGAPQSSATPGPLDANQVGFDPLVRNQWFTIEVEAVMNTTTTTSDGVFRLWTNGVLTCEYTNVRYAEGSDPLEWRRLNLNPYYGGSVPSHIIPADCFIHVDQYAIYSSTSRT